MAGPRETTVPLTIYGEEVKMTGTFLRIGVAGASEQLYTQALASCTAIATFCHHSGIKTLTHLRPGEFVKKLGETLAHKRYVHDDDMIIIALGNDAYLPNRQNDFETVKGELEEGFRANRENRVTRIDWRLNFVPDAAKLLLNAYTFVIERGHYGRAGYRTAPPVSGGGGSSGGGSSDGPPPNHFRRGLQAGKIGGAAGAGAGGGNAGAPKKAATRGGRAK